MLMEFGRNFVLVYLFAMFLSGGCSTSGNRSGVRTPASEMPTSSSPKVEPTFSKLEFESAILEKMYDLQLDGENVIVISPKFETDQNDGQSKIKIKLSFSSRASIAVEVSDSLGISLKDFEVLGDPTQGMARYLQSISSLEELDTSNEGFQTALASDPLFNALIGQLFDHFSEKASSLQSRRGEGTSRKNRAIAAETKTPNFPEFYSSVAGVVSVIVPTFIATAIIGGFLTVASYGTAEWVNTLPVPVRLSTTLGGLKILHLSVKWLRYAATEIAVYFETMIGMDTAKLDRYLLTTATPHRLNIRAGYASFLSSVVFSSERINQNPQKSLQRLKWVISRGFLPLSIGYIIENFGDSVLASQIPNSLLKSVKNFEVNFSRVKNPQSIEYKTLWSELHQWLKKVRVFPSDCAGIFSGK